MSSTNISSPAPLLAQHPGLSSLADGPAIGVGGVAVGGGGVGGRGHEAGGAEGGGGDGRPAKPNRPKSRERSQLPLGGFRLPPRN